MSWNPWSFTSPFIPYTPILAEEMNPKLNGISASFTYVANELNNFVPRLPNNFTGSVTMAEGSYTSTIMGIDEFGDVALIDQASFLASINKDFIMKTVTDNTLVVGGENHGDWFLMNYATVGEGQIQVTVGQATEIIEGVNAEAKAATIIFTQDSETSLVFVEAPGVTIKSPGHLIAYGKNSTVTLIAVDQYTWVMGGDVRPTELIV